MFRKELEEKLKDIFGLRKVTFDAPGESFEQDTLFVEVTEAPSRFTQGKAYTKVLGNLVIYSQHGKLPYGYFMKRLQQAKPELTKNLFLFDADQDIAASGARLQNVEERRSKFMYLYSAQYDPDQGSLTGLTLEGGFNG